MTHEHEFHDMEEEGFDGLGRKEQSEADFDPAGTVYYQIARCHCEDKEYRSWLFDMEDFEQCCEKRHPDEPTVAMEYSIIDFKAPDEQVTVGFKCEYCGETQEVESSKVYSSIKRR